eukprot:scaffold7949_cov72-Skeletonema_marinoi.AAC.2
MVQCVIEHVPRAVSVVDRRGATPLHLVCFNKNVTLDIFRCVFDGNQAALLKQDEDGCTPLIWLCCNKALNETVAVEISKLLLEMCPESAQCGTHDGFLPIRFAFVVRSPEFCGVLIQKFPESMQHEVRGVSELHNVLFSSDVKDSVSLAVLKMLLENHPRMARYARRNGWTPLHYAASNHLPRAVKVCRLLIRAFPELVLELDESGLQPLHTACLYGNLPVVKCILDMHPDAIRGESSGGNFPIHFAVHPLALDSGFVVAMIEARDSDWWSFRQYKRPYDNNT